MRQQSMWAEK